MRLNILLKEIATSYQNFYAMHKYYAVFTLIFLLDKHDFAFFEVSWVLSPCSHILSVNSLPASLC